MGLLRFFATLYHTCELMHYENEDIRRLNNRVRYLEDLVVSSQGLEHTPYAPFEIQSEAQRIVSDRQKVREEFEKMGKLLKQFK